MPSVANDLPRPEVLCVDLATAIRNKLNDYKRLDQRIHETKSKERYHS